MREYGFSLTRILPYSRVFDTEECELPRIKKIGICLLPPVNNIQRNTTSIIGLIFREN